MEGVGQRRIRRWEYLMMTRIRITKPIIRKPIITLIILPIMIMASIHNAYNVSFLKEQRYP